MSANPWISTTDQESPAVERLDRTVNLLMETISELSERIEVLELRETFHRTFHPRGSKTVTEAVR